MTLVMQVLHGAAMDVLKTLDKNSIDCVFTCPSPFRYYSDNEPNYIGGEKQPQEYIFNLAMILDECIRVLKPEGSLFVQLGDKFHNGLLMCIPSYFELTMIQRGYLLNDRIIWHRTETHRKPPKPEKGFLKNYEYIFHFVKDPNKFYFNTSSKYTKTSVFSYPLEDTYYTNEFDSGLPYQLSEMVIDTTCPKNGIVLDPLCGSGKVGVVAKKMNRDFIGIDINLETVEACRIRLGL